MVANKQRSGDRNTRTGDKNTRNITVPFCKFCNKNYHTEEECWEKHPELKKNTRRDKGPQSKKRKTGDKEDQEESSHTITLMAIQRTVHSLTALQSTLDVSNLWVIDSGCNQHITHNKASFINYTPFTSANHSVGGIGGKALQPQGQGTIRLQCVSKGK